MRASLSSQFTTDALWRFLFKYASRCPVVTGSESGTATQTKLRTAFSAELFKFDLDIEGIIHFSSILRFHYGELFRFRTERREEDKAD
mmetsp:Transcript_36572/g.79046  ORF Transcript_36572/g.79046 Transcript_36572/m.79046 type:complete len:88 (-) Transcript_36572:29-292(-)